MQVEPIKPKLKAPITSRLELKYDEPPSDYAFKSNLRRYTLARISCFFLKFLPHWFRLWFFWGPLVRGPFGQGGH